MEATHKATERSAKSQLLQFGFCNGEGSSSSFTLFLSSSQRLVKHWHGNLLTVGYEVEFDHLPLESNSKQLSLKKTCFIAPEEQ